MTTPTDQKRVLGPRRLRTMRWFLWLSVTGTGIALGAKLFDLLVVAGAWGASPPASFVHLPYGKDYPIDPGAFFQPLSVIMLVGIVGALVSGWRSVDRIWLWVPLITFLVIWAITPTIFWSMIHEMWSIHKARISRSDAEILLLVRRWFIWDSFRVGLIAVVFFASVRALIGSTTSQKQPLGANRAVHEAGRQHGA